MNWAEKIKLKAILDRLSLRQVPALINMNTCLLLTLMTYDHQVCVKLILNFSEAYIADFKGEFVHVDADFH